MKIQQHDGSIVEIEKSSKEAFEVLNHSTSHLLAEAIQELYPDLNDWSPNVREEFLIQSL